MNSYGLVLAVLASILWGLTYCLDERVLASLSVFKLYFLHCLCGVLVAGAILRMRGLRQPACSQSIRQHRACPWLACIAVGKGDSPRGYHRGQEWYSYLNLPGYGTGYLPSGSACTGAGESAVNSATPAVRSSPQSRASW
jgi:hypothetical protein